MDHATPPSGAITRPTITNGHCWAAAVLKVATNTGFVDIESVVVLFTRLVTKFMVEHWGQGSFMCTLLPMYKGIADGLSEEDIWNLVTGYGADFKIETLQVTPEYGKLWTATLYERLMLRNLRSDGDIAGHRYVYGTHVEIAVLAYILNMEVR
jgi:hypothetical protein